MSNSKKHPNLLTARLAPWLWTAGAVAAVVLVGTALDGNEHGASRTDLDIMPSYAVEPLVPQVTEAAPPVPSRAAKASMLVCRNSIFLDWQQHQVIVRPVINNASDARPLQLNNVTANGPEFADAQPRDNFQVMEIDGGEDEDQLLGPNDCAEEEVRTVRVKQGKHETFVLTDGHSDIAKDESISASAVGAVCNGLVHAQFDFQGTGQMDAFVEDLQSRGC